MTQNIGQQDVIVQFLRKRDYALIKELGQGACGKTVLLHDTQIDEYFVCKKYLPISESHRQELFINFVREIKLLHKIHHPNIVRVFNYYLYPDQCAGYILMEYIAGSEIDDFLTKSPEQTNSIFIQAITGFAYLERTEILHRDIRTGNIMVRDDGTVKIIDLGFGKEIRNSKDFEKSISLHRWCEPPSEYDDARYDFCTEVYFVGKLFEKIIQDNGISHFQYTDILDRMCQRNASKRIASFTEIEKEIGNKKFYEIDFSTEELQIYRDFSNAIYQQITKLDKNIKYADDMERIQIQMEEAYRKLMLEVNVPDAALILRCFIIGEYYYRKTGLSVDSVKEFMRFMKSNTDEKNRIVLANLYTKLDALPRYSAQDEYNERVPF